MTLERASSPRDLDVIRRLFREYAAGLTTDLAFQGFEEEVRSLPGDYAEPLGTLILARVHDQHLGCVGVRPFSADIAEMKRLFVRPPARGAGTGQALARAAVHFARTAGYRALRLDTLPEMGPARALYERLGFRTIEPYRHNPIAGTAFLELTLRPDA